MVLDRIALGGEDNTDARLFVGPRGGRIATGVLRDATHWDEVVTKLGYEHLRRHDLRHTGLTWMAHAGVSLHLLQKIAGHADSRTMSDTYTRSAGRSPMPATSFRTTFGPALRVVG
nr:tyrosine-type recombinase/integrase [Nocardia fluminea]